MFGLDLSTLGWILVALIVMVISYIYMTWPYNYFKNMGIPGPKPVPFLGNMNEMSTDPFWLKDEEWVKKYGKVFGTYFFARKNLMVADREMLREIFIKDFDNFCDRMELPNRGILRHGLLDMKGQAWKDQRHQLSPYFSAGTMKMSIKSMNRIMDNLISWLDEKCEKGEMVEAKDFCQMMTLDVICTTAFGVDVNSCKDPDNELLKQGRDVSKQFTAGNILAMLCFVIPPFGKLLDLLNIQSVNLDYFVKFTKKLIEKHKEMSGETSHDFVNVLLKERKGSSAGLSDEAIIANAVLFLLAGYDTTAGTLSFLFYNFVVHPECQEKAYQEIQDVIGNEDPSYEKVQQLGYLDMCLDETMRLYPLATRIERDCVRDTVVKGVTIEKGITVSMPIWQIHRDPEIWEDPEAFIPERFTPENKRNRDPLTFAPFGVGPRHCIGMRLALLEVKMATAWILRKFKLVKNEKTEVPIELDPQAFVLTAKNGVWLSMERRN